MSDKPTPDLLEANFLKDDQFTDLRDAGVFKLILDHPEFGVYRAENHFVLHIPGAGAMQVYRHKPKPRKLESRCKHVPERHEGVYWVCPTCNFNGGQPMKQGVCNFCGSGQPGEVRGGGPQECSGVHWKCRLCGFIVDPESKGAQSE